MNTLKGCLVALGCLVLAGWILYKVSMPVASANSIAYKCINLMKLCDEYRETTGRAPTSLSEVMKTKTTDENQSCKQDVDLLISTYAPTILIVDSKDEQKRAIWCQASKNADSRWVRYQEGPHIAKGQNPPANAVVWWTPERKRSWPMMEEE
jgi:hypothetical protein